MSKAKDMPKEKDGSERAEESEGSGLKPLQVLAAGLAAVTAAFLGSSLGVYGTVLGAGVISVATTIGSELYLRSLHRTRQAALRSKQVLAGGRTRQQQAVSADGAPEGDDRTVLLPRPGQEAATDERGEPTRLRKLRWPLIIATSVLAFLIGMLVLTGFELTTGKPVSGGEGSTIGNIVGGGGQPAGGDQDGEPPGGRDSGTTTPTRTGEPQQPEDGDTGGGETSEPTSTPETTPSTPESSAPPTSSRSVEPSNADSTRDNPNPAEVP
ncbi:hypothetical protein [Amycolatopsis aidingensis]|uniref:hypothetical protein n=1 Tax=Amycolatopsis aidingensis TaxID=2842453 RepID=UPI001C0E68F0|nr:hypothetical protein [Amycolatopsis aidingensis]